MTNYLIYDTETSDFLTKGNEKLPPDKQPWIVQMGMILTNGERDFIKMSLLIQSDGRMISDGAKAVHKISTDDCNKGLPEKDALHILCSNFKHSDYLVCHNVGFDIPMTLLALRRNGYNLDADVLEKLPKICTMQASTKFCALPAKWGFKWPKLEELHEKLFGFKPLSGDLHDALSDCFYTKKCFFEMKDREII